MKILKTVLLASSIFFFFSCESEQETFEEEQEVNVKKGQNYQSKTSTYIRRNKLKQRDVLYIATFNVDNSSDQIKSFAFLLEGSNGSLETVLKPSGKKDAEGLEIYAWDFDGEGMFDDSDEAKVTATPLNADGEAIADAQVFYAVIRRGKLQQTQTVGYQSKASTFIRSNKLKKKQTVGYRATFNVDNSSEQIKSFAFLLESANGSLETVLKPNGKKDAEGLEIYAWDFDGDGVFDDSDEAKITATPLNADGEAIADAQVFYTIIRRGKIQTIGSSSTNFRTK